MLALENSPVVSEVPSFVLVISLPVLEEKGGLRCGYTKASKKDPFHEISGNSWKTFDP